MAYCPRCECQIGSMEKFCPHCGYDLVTPGEPREREGLAFSSLATVSLVIGEFVAAIAAVLRLITCILSVTRGEFLDGLVVGPIEFFLLIAVFVVFIRVEKL